MDYVPFTTDFDQSFSQVPHYRLYPELYPWVGKHYVAQDTKILVLGESHYLHESSGYHLDAAAWYEGLSLEGKCDKHWIITRDIVSNGIKNGWRPRSKLIYKNIEGALLEAKVTGPAGETPFSTIAFYNYFQRPAEKSGDSIRVTELDRSHSAATLIAMLGILKPNIVLFCSKKAWRAAKASDVVRCASENSIRLVSTVHPSTSWWNRPMKSYKNRTGKQIFVEALLPVGLTGEAGS